MDPRGTTTALSNARARVPAWMGAREPIPRPSGGLQIGGAVGLIVGMVLPTSRRPEPADVEAESPRDEEAILPELAPLKRGSAAPQLRATKPAERGPAKPAASSYSAPTGWAKIRLYSDPFGLLRAWRVRRMYRALRMSDRLSYLKHFEGETASESATNGLRVVEFANASRRVEKR